MAIGNLIWVSSGSRTGLTADPSQERLTATQAGLVVHQAESLNCETPPALLGGDVTPTAQFYRRSHFPMPLLDETAWRLDVGGMVRQPLSLSLHDLTQLPAETAVVTLECAGNGRTLFRPQAPGVQWAFGAVGTAEWTGPLLADVLARAGIERGACEVIFGGADLGTVEASPDPIRFERSLPVRDALESGALLAYAMNGHPLPVRHGYPLRLVVPGWYAVASVKWLTDIRVVADPFDGFFQNTHYVYEWDRRGTGAREPIRLQQVRAVITRPATGQELACGTVTVRGVAWSGAAPVARVDVSVADGPWQKARLVGVPSAHGWQQWEFLASGLAPGETRIRARAADMAGRVQPEQPEWNRLGYAANFIHEVRALLRLPGALLRLPGALLRLPGALLRLPGALLCRTRGAVPNPGRCCADPGNSCADPGSFCAELSRAGVPGKAGAPLRERRRARPRRIAHLAASSRPEVLGGSGRLWATRGDSRPVAPVSSCGRWG
jgi:DMSO/TMAO reductase YedYZ molybdopterin-dependent catalytic subunit